MEPQNQSNELNNLAEALSDLRDSWVRISMVLKDHLAETPSPERDEIVIQVERQLVRIREGERGEA